MIKVNKTIFIILIISLLVFLFIPSKFCQLFGLIIFNVILLSFLYTKLLSRKIIIERNLTTLHLACNEQTDIVFNIKNYSFLPVFCCYVNDDISATYVFHNGNRDVLLLRPKEIKTIKYRIHVQQRGELFAGPVTIRFSDPFNIFTYENEIDVKMKIIVRPARIQLQTKPLPGLPQGGLKINNPCYEDITMRRSIREYRNGDELKRVNWRVSAKFNQFYTNEYENTFDVPFFIFVNLAEEDYIFEKRPYKIERALELAAAIVERAAILNLRCGFAAYGTDFPYLKPAANQTECILDLIALIKPVAGKLDYDPVKKLKTQLPFGTQFFFIGPEEVDNYDNKILANNSDINTTNLIIWRPLWK